MNMKILVIVLGLVVSQACDVINSGLLGASDAGGAPKDAPSDTVIDMPEPGMILRYAFEDSGTTARDISGRQKDGSVYLTGVNSSPDTLTSAAWTAEGRNGRGLALTGVQYVALPEGVLDAVDDFTVATWVKIKTTADWARIYDFGDAGGDQFMYMTISGYRPDTPAASPPVNDGLHISSFGGSAANENWFGTSTKLPTAVWKHIAVTGSGGDRHVYIDGFPAGSHLGGPIVPPRRMEPMGANSWLGKSHFATDVKLNGSLDDFRIYNRALTATDIEELAWPQHDYSYWRFDEGSGTSAKDSSDNALAATLTSDVTWTTGRLGGAVKLPGGPPGSSGPHLSLATSPLATCTEFTAAVWVKLDALDSSRIFDFGTGTTNYIYLAVSDGTGAHFGMGAQGKTPFDLHTPSQLPLDGLWHHIAVTLLAGTATIYVDGALAVTGGGTSIRPLDVGATTQNWIGQSRLTGSDRYLSGSLDELRIACRAYTADEITNLSRP